MRGILSKLGYGAAALTVWFYTSEKYHEDGDYYVDKETDSYIEEVYLADSTVEVVPLKSWLKESEKNVLYEIDRNMASQLSDSLQAAYGIELKACIDPEFGDDEAFALLGKLGTTKDFESLAKTIRTSVSEYSTIDIGEEWLLIEL